MIPLAIGRDRSDVAQRIAAARSTFPDARGRGRLGKASFLVGSPRRGGAPQGVGSGGRQRVLLQMLDMETWRDRALRSHVPRS